jgi:PAS domain S-box-containing protein
MLGYAPDEMVGHFPWEFVGEDDKPAAHERQRRRLQGLPDTQDNRYQRKDGSILWAHAQSFPLLDEHGTATGAVGMLADITEQRAADELRARLAAIVDSSEDAIVGETLDGLITTWNAAATGLYGYEAAEIVGQPLTLLVPEERAEELRFDILRRVPAIPFETVHHGKDGSPLHVAVRRSPIYDARGEIVGVSTSVRDISDRLHAEALRRRGALLEEERRRALEESRLKSNFLAGMSHEFRTPLTAISGFAEFLHDGSAGELSADQVDLVGNILTSARHLTRLVNDVLDLAKVEAGKIDFRPELVDLAQTVREVRDVLQTMTAEKQLRITTRIDHGLGQIVVDAGRLKQVLYNFLSNAIKFTPPGGRIAVTMQAAGDDAFRASVRDSGIGISPEALPLLFTEFVQLDDRTAGHAAGTGLGLALTKRIVEAQGGTVGVRSAPGKGSTFFAVLPRRPRPSDAGLVQEGA